MNLKKFNAKLGRNRLNGHKNMVINAMFFKENYVKQFNKLSCAVFNKHNCLFNKYEL